MSKVRFEEDELGIIAMFEKDTVKDTMEYIEDAITFLEKDDEELRQLMKSTVSKMKNMSEEEFKSYDFFRYQFEEEEDES